MFPLLLVLFITIPLAEIAVLIWVGGYLGAAETIALLLLVSLVGAWLAKRQGLGILARVRQDMQLGRVPGQELIDGLFVLVAAAFLLTPGFITDAVALALLLPPVRMGLRSVARKVLARRVAVRVWGAAPPAGGRPGRGRPDGGAHGAWEQDELGVWHPPEEPPGAAGGPR